MSKIDETRKTQPIKIGEKLGFMGFSGSNNIVYQFKSIYYLFFLTNVLKLNVGIAGLILTAGTIWDAINDPLIGYWAVNRRFKNGEAVRPFALWHSVPWAVTVVLIFSDFGVSNRAAAILALIFYIFFEIFNTTVGLPYNAMAGLATNRDEDRRSINVFRNLGGCIGSGIGAVMCLPLLKLFGALDASGNLSDADAPRGFLLVAIVMGAIVVAGSVTHYLTTHERVKQRAEDTEKIPARVVASMLWRCRSWRFNTVYILCYGVINMLLMTGLTYYATYVLGSTASATMIQAAYLGASVLASFTVGAVDKRIGRRKAMIFPAIVAVLGKIWFVIQPDAVGAIYLNAVTVGISVTFAYVLFNTNRNNMVDIIEASDGRRIDSMVASLDNLASKLAVAGATLLSTFLLQRAGYDANLDAQPAAAITVINTMLGWAPVIASLVMLVCAFFIPIEREYAEAQQKLTRKKD
jgi:sugar (glycoside-pentoside-hexuronide) transporter